MSRWATMRSEPAVISETCIGPGYDVPVLVLAAGQCTLAVSMATRAGTWAIRWRSMMALTELALSRTAR